MKLSSFPLVALFVTAAACAASSSAPDDEVAATSPAFDSSPPPPASTASIADPGVYLQDDTFYAFFTGSGLQQTTSNTAGGPWTAPTDVLNPVDLPAWIDASKAIWAPDMIRDAQGDFVVYFAAALNRSAGTPTGDDAPASNARCNSRTAVERSPWAYASARYGNARRYSPSS